MGNLWQDLRYAVRVLTKSPGFTVVAVLTLALGIGANTAIFSVIENVLLRPLPFPAPEQLVWLNGKFPQSDEAAVSPLDFVDYRAGNRSFDGLAAMRFAASPSNLLGDKPEQVLSTAASAQFFSILGVHPLFGRDFLKSDEQVSEAQVAILGYGIWKRDFGGDPAIVGRNIRMDGQSYVVVGVLPRDLPLLTEAQIWLPTPLLARFMNFRLGHSLRVIGRLKPGVSLQQSQADLDAIAGQLARQYPDSNRGWTLRQRLLSEVLVGPVRPALLLMWAAAGLMLLIACVNVANLLLSRSVARQSEFALRAALGAGRGRLIRQALTESLLIALAGGALGVVAATCGVSALRAIGPVDLPRGSEIHINMAVLAFTAAISLLTGVTFGLLPALHISRRGLPAGLKESGRTSVPAAYRRISGALVVGEIAVSLTLLVGAGLLLKSFWLLVHVNPGFRTEHVVTARLSLGGPAYADPASRARFWQELEERVSSLPGVKAVGATSYLPLSGRIMDNPFHLPGRSYGPSEFDDAPLSVRLRLAIWFYDGHPS